MASPVLAAPGIVVGPGAIISLGAGDIDMNCTDYITTGDDDIGSGSITEVLHFIIQATGTVTGGSGQVQLSGDWENNGTFTPGTSQVHIQDGCAMTTSNMVGDTDFNSFTATSSTGKELRVEAGSTQTFSQDLTLMGVDNSNRMPITSSSAGSQAFFSLDNAGTQVIDAVNVMDNNASGGQLLAPDQPSVFASLDSGNNLNWFLYPGVTKLAVPVPTLPVWAMILLSMLLMTVVSKRRNLFILNK